MDILVRGKNVEVSDALRDAALERLGRLDRFANGVGRAEVDFSEARNPRVAESQRCEVLVHLKGQLVKSHAAAAEPFAALALVADKIEHLMKKLKDKRVSRSHPRRPPVDDGPEVPEEGEEDAGEASVVKTKRFALKPMSLGEAALQMELLGHDFFLFTSSDSGRAAVVYRRHDGDLGLIEAAG